MDVGSTAIGCYADPSGRLRFRWVDGEIVRALACDILIPGYGCDYVTNMRLWTALSSRGFNLQEFSHGDYVGAVVAKVYSENISKVLYPSDEVASGRELRLKQQTFCFHVQTIIRRTSDRTAPLPISQFRCDPAK